MREIRYVDAKVDIYRSRLPQIFRDESKMGKKSIGHACFEDICRALAR